VTRFLAVPGRGVPKPAHWLREWAARPGWAWAPEPPGPPLVFADRIAALEAAVASSAEPVVLVAHSGGCIVTVKWAQEHAGPVRAALLVTPPDMGDMVSVPMAPLPFRSIVVASSNDPYATAEDFAAYAAAWGSELVQAGAVGHLDSKTGFGPWPEGERLLAGLATG
jgi:predicted alpha/beta hydrolase family esterase